MKTLSVFLMLVTSTAAASTQREVAISQGNWEAVTATNANDPASRFLQAHALLTQGDSDHAICGFAGLQASQDVAAWDNWTRTFVSLHPNSATANYLRGDALARMADWPGALSSFDKALALDPHYALALDARGVVRTITGQYDAGLLDFAAAATFNRQFVDAHINRAVPLHPTERIGYERFAILRLRPSAQPARHTCRARAGTIVGGARQTSDWPQRG